MGSNKSKTQSQIITSTEPKRKLRIICISDSHNNHRKLQLPIGDILIHAGDFSHFSDIEHAIDFNEWLGTLDFKYKVIVNGNHDSVAPWQSKVKEILTNCIFLNQERIEIEGVKLYGIEFKWPYREQKMHPNHQIIPQDTDILISHNPAFSYVDHHQGCPSLLLAIKQIKPKLVVCGHIHLAHGIEQGKQKDGLENTKFVNAALCDNSYRLKFEPIVVEI